MGSAFISQRCLHPQPSLTWNPASFAGGKSICRFTLIWEAGTETQATPAANPASLNRALSKLCSKIPCQTWGKRPGQGIWVVLPHLSRSCLSYQGITKKFSWQTFLPGRNSSVSHPEHPEHSRAFPSASWQLCRKWPVWQCSLCVT